MAAFTMHAEMAFYPDFSQLPDAPMPDDAPEVAHGMLRLGKLHVGRDETRFGESWVIAGELRCNDTLLFSDGRYVGPPDLPKRLNNITSTPGLCIAMVFGGSGYRDFRAIRLLHARHGAGFVDSGLQRNLLAMRATLPLLDCIELCCEDTYDYDSFIAFASLLVGLGFEIVLPPSPFREFRGKVFAELCARHPGRVHDCHPQSLAKENGNDSRQPADALESLAPGFDAEWTENTPKKIRESLRGLARETRLGSSASWSLERIIA